MGKIIDFEKELYLSEISDNPHIISIYPTEIVIRNDVIGEYISIDLASFEMLSLEVEKYKKAIQILE